MLVNEVLNVVTDLETIIDLERAAEEIGGGLLFVDYMFKFK